MPSVIWEFAGSVCDFRDMKTRAGFLRRTLLLDKNSPSADIFMNRRNGLKNISADGLPVNLF